MKKLIESAILFKRIFITPVTGGSNYVFDIYLYPFSHYLHFATWNTLDHIVAKSFYIILPSENVASIVVIGGMITYQYYSQLQYPIIQNRRNKLLPVTFIYIQFYIRNC
jgi:hypothetical protein